MSKYSALREHLIGSQGSVRLSFAEIEEILGFKLPQSARRYPAWWSNSGSTHVQAAAWQAAGYETQQVDLNKQTVHFVPARRTGFGEMQQTAFTEPDGAPGRKHPLFGCMKGTKIVMPGVDLTEPADPDWGKVYDDDYRDEVFAPKDPDAV